MDEATFAGHVRACNEFYTGFSYSHAQTKVEAYMAKNDIPEFWREPIRVMAAGAYYYGADAWMKANAE